MPRLEELECYLRGIWMLLLGQAEGFRWLDISPRGFWRSWWAIAFCAPPILISWLAFRNSYLDMLPDGAHVADHFYFKLLLVEICGWTVPTLFMVAIAQVSGHGNLAVPLVIVTNWLSVPLQWLYALENLVQIFAPGAEALAAILFLMFLTTSLLAHYRVISRITADDKLMPAALVLTLFVVSFFSQYKLMQVTGLWLS